MRRARAALLVLLLPVAVSAEPAAAPARKLVIAHRGASGYLPEHTLAGYALAHGLGADFIEPDLVMTRDGVLVALHDLHLEATTDAAERFPGRARSDGHHWVLDFSLDEVRRLSVREPREGRFRGAPRAFPVPTFDEVLELVRELNRLRGREVGVYPELKRPEIHRAAGLDPEAALLTALRRHGWAGPDAPVFVQSFDARSLSRLRFELGARVRLVQLIGEHDSQDGLVADAGLDGVARYAAAIGPARARVEADPGLVARAHARGLLVHPYTFRADEDGEGGFEALLRRFLFEYDVDGLFTDHADRAVAVRDAGPPD